MEKVTVHQKSTQRIQIMRHLKENGTITQLEALREYGIMRLASRISELKKRGEPISKVMRSATNRYGETVRYAEYSLKMAE